MTELIRRVSALRDVVDHYWHDEKWDRYSPSLEDEYDPGEPPLPPEAIGLRQLLASLTREQLIALFAVVQVGQERLATSEVQSRLTTQLDSFRLQDMQCELSTTAFLSAHLGRGVEHLRRCGVNIDTLPLPATGVRPP